MIASPVTPGEVADHMVNLQIHLGQRLVHVLHVLPGHADQLAPMAQQRAHLTEVGLGPKGGAEEPHGMEILEPLAFVPVGSSTRHVLHVPGIHQARRYSGTFTSGGVQGIQ